MKKKAKKKFKKPQKQSTVKALAFCKRYWYWFVALVVVTGGVLGWCGGMGLFDKPTDMSILSENISFIALSNYRLNDYSGGEKVSYSVIEGQNVVTINNNVLYGNSVGKAKLLATAGNASKEISVEVSPYVIDWKVDVNFRIKKSVLDNIVSKISTEIDTFEIINTELIDETMENGEEVYYTREEGVLVFSYSNNDVTLCNFFVAIIRNLGSDKVVYDENPTLYNVNVDFNKQPNVKETKSVSMYQTLDLSTDVLFGIEGIIYYQTSDSRLARVNQSGKIDVLLAGTARITVACLGLNSVEYYSIVLEIAPIEISIWKHSDNDDVSRAVRLNEIITREELLSASEIDDVVDFRIATSDYLEQANNGYRAIATTDQSECAHIYGLDVYGNVIVDYLIEISEE